LLVDIANQNGKHEFQIVSFVSYMSN